MGQENKPDNFCLAEKRSKALGDGALYSNVNNRCKPKQKNRLHIFKICPFVWASDRFSSE